MPFPSILIEAILLGLEEEAGATSSGDSAKTPLFRDMTHAFQNDPLVTFHLHSPSKSAGPPPSFDHARNTSPTVAVKSPAILFGSSQVAIFDRKKTRKRAKISAPSHNLKVSMPILKQLSSSPYARRKGNATVPPTHMNSFFLFKRDLEQYIRQRLHDRPAFLGQCYAMAAIPKIAGIIWRYMSPATKAVYVEGAKKARATISI